MKKLFWGLFFLLAAAFVVVNQLGYITTDINIFLVVCTIFLIPIFISSVVKLNFFGALFSAAAILIIYKEPLNIEQIENTTILLTALLGSIGLSIIFHKNHMTCKSHCSENYEKVIDYQDEDEINLDVSFGSSIKYINTDNFKVANIKSSFGGVKVYFDNAKIKDDTATINLDVSFSGVELYIPKEWKIVNKVNISLGAVEQKNDNRSETTKTIVLTGDVRLGGVDIICV